MNLEKRTSKIHGKGIFTGTPIPEGTEFYSVPTDFIYDRPMPRCARIGKGAYVHDDAVLNWINHSCSPNAILDVEREKPVLVALKEICTDEEITVDYCRTERDAARLSCLCRSEKCRGYFWIS